MPTVTLTPANPIDRVARSRLRSNRVWVIVTLFIFRSSASDRTRVKNSFCSAMASTLTPHRRSRVVRRTTSHLHGMSNTASRDHAPSTVSHNPMISRTTTTTAFLVSRNTSCGETRRSRCGTPGAPSSPRRRSSATSASLLPGIDIVPPPPAVSCSAEGVLRMPMSDTWLMPTSRVSAD